MKVLPTRRSLSPQSEAEGQKATPARRSRLGLELTFALTFKVVVLAALWFAFFRPDPDHRRPSRADLFSRPAPSGSQQGESP